VKIFWWLWRNFSVVRKRFAVGRLPETPFSQIVGLEGKQSPMSFGMGTPASEQKIAILGYETSENRRFFAKYSTKPAAIRLSNNETEVLERWQSSGLTPRLFDKKSTANFVFFKTEYIEGKRFRHLALTDAVTDLAIKINSLDLAKDEKTGLLSSLSHGDFCPWNILETAVGLRLIDWEMAANRTVGYDLFTCIFQTAALFQPDFLPEKVLKINSKQINRYFQHFEITDFTQYLLRFAETKFSYEKEKEGRLSESYAKILNYAKTL
jgi:hypothetical protein